MGGRKTAGDGKPRLAAESLGPEIQFCTGGEGGLAGFDQGGGRWGEEVGKRGIPVRTSDRFGRGRSEFASSVGGDTQLGKGF